MRTQQTGKLLYSIDERFRSIDEFYDPLQPNKIIQDLNGPPLNAARSLFGDDDTQFDENGMQNRPRVKTVPPPPNAHVLSDNDGTNFFMKLLRNNNPPKPKKKSNDSIKIPPEYEPFCFNNNIILKYPQTPHFKTQLQSPFGKFNSDHRVHMETLKLKPVVKTEFVAIKLDKNPSQFSCDPLKFFVGVAMTLKQKECINASRALLKLGCYVEPFNQRSWKKYIEYQEQYGYIYKAFLLSKTAFLFTQQEDFARSYLSNGEKCGVALGEMRGILSSAQSPDIFEKGVLVEIGKLTLKHQQIWKGLKVLYEICQWNEFRLPVCALIIFLTKYLENIGEREKALQILKRSFGRGMSKLEVYTTYLEMKIRQDKGVIRESVIKEVSEYVDCISSENRYRLYLEIAEILYLKNDSRYKYYIEQSYLTAKKFCAQGAGCNKTLRQIYYTLLRWKNASPPPAVPSDSNYFEANRYEYIRNGQLNTYDFTDWKYYLHYGLMKRCDLLLEASKKWSYTGRLIAEWIHSMRDSRPPKEVLKIWREKIDEVPKSGELWCQGGRIYAQLHEYENASKCFKAAIHFTPQYGDSFIEQLRIFLLKGQYLQAHKLKKIMLVSEPFYGHVWSFLRESNPTDAKLSLIDMWELATEKINNNLYQQNVDLMKPADKDYRLLTAYAPYNQAYLNPSSAQIRQKLYASYEQLDNKN